MKKRRIISQTKESLINSRGCKCEKCGREEKQMLTVDHIVPQTILLAFGLDIGECYQDEFVTILCRICNYVKSSKLDFTDKRTKQILIKLLEKV